MKGRNVSNMTVFPSNKNFIFIETSPLPYPQYEVDAVSVLDSVKILFSRYFKDIDAHPLIVKNVHPNNEYPMTVYEEYTIYLDVSPLNIDGTPGLFWCQFMHQFAHELCHYMNFGHVVRPMRWFEECLCELASHFFMIKNTEQWAVFPLYPGWADYAPRILSYEISQRNDVFPINITELSEPHSLILDTLMNNEYQRPLNRYIALKLLPLFIDNSALWNMIPFLTSLPADKCFTENLQLLGALSGEDISKVLNLFGIVK